MNNFEALNQKTDKDENYLEYCKKIIMFKKYALINISNPILKSVLEILLLLFKIVELFYLLQNKYLKSSFYSNELIFSGHFGSCGLETR